MKKGLKRIGVLAVGAVFAVLAVRLAPSLLVTLFGSENTQWISERFSEVLREKNELVVYQIETTGQETVVQDAWLIGTVQKVEIPYTFQMHFTVDLSQAQVSVAENLLEVSVPAPVAGYQKLTVDEANVQKRDWLYPLTPERYETIQRELEQKLFEQYSQNDTYRQNAWDVTVHNLETLFGSIAEQSAMGQTCEIRIVLQQE